VHEAQQIAVVENVPAHNQKARQVAAPVGLQPHLPDCRKVSDLGFDQFDQRVVRRDNNAVTAREPGRSNCGCRRKKLKAIPQDVGIGFAKKKGMPSRTASQYTAKSTSVPTTPTREKWVPMAGLCPWPSVIGGYPAVIP